MSDMWLGAGEALRITARTGGPAGGFTPWGARPLSPASFVPRGRAEEPIRAEPLYAEEEEAEPVPLTPVIDPEAIALDGFARGYEEGRRSLERELAAEREGVRRLAEALESLRPEPPAALAAVLAATVGRLVRQIVGEAGVDEALLLARATRAAALVTEEMRPARLRLHPEDLRRLAGAALPVALVADEALVPGSLMVECREGWIEDGVSVALAQLEGLMK